MKLNISAEMVGNEIITCFLQDLKKNNIDASPNEVKIIVSSKDGKEIELTPDRLRLVFGKTQV